MLNPGNFLRYGAQGRRRILTHELLHAATRGWAGPFVASFLEEGLAELAASGPGAEAPRERAGGVPDDFDFVTGDGQMILAAYRRSHSAAKFVAETYGLDALNRFYEVLGAARVEPGTRAYHLERALRESLGVGRAELEAGWAAWSSSG